jgi:hypothetical protein
MGARAPARLSHGLALLASLIATACSENSVNGPASADHAGSYTLTAFYQRDTPAIPGIPGVRVFIDDCGNDADPPNASFVFSDSSTLRLQQTPQDYALAFVGRLTDCAGLTTPFFDVVAGRYLLVDGRWLTLEGDAVHPHLDGQLEDAGDTLEIQLRPARPGLPYPLSTVDRLAFRRAK